MEKVAIKNIRVLLDKITHRKDIRDEKNEPRLKFVETHESKKICT